MIPEPTVTVSVREVTGGVLSESREITWHNLPADASEETLGQLLGTAHRATSLISALLKNQAQPVPITISRPKVNMSVFDDDGPGDAPVAAVVNTDPPDLTAGAIPHASPTPSAGQEGERPAPIPDDQAAATVDFDKYAEDRVEKKATLLDEYDPAADTLELKPETLRKSGAWSDTPAAGHPEFCRCGDCYDAFHDDADPYADHVAGCQCGDCLKSAERDIIKEKQIPGEAAKVQTAESDPSRYKHPESSVLQQDAGQPQESAGKSPDKSCSICGLKKADNPTVTFCHRGGETWNCLPCFNELGAVTRERPSNVGAGVVAHKIENGSCTACGGADKSLTTSCPGCVLTTAQGQAIISGKLDFVPEGWKSLSGTNALGQTITVAGAQGPTASGQSRAGEAKAEPASRCAECAGELFGGGVDGLCHECNRQKTEAGQVIEIDAAELKGLEPGSAGVSVIETGNPAPSQQDEPAGPPSYGIPDGPDQRAQDDVRIDRAAAKVRYDEWLAKQTIPADTEVSTTISVFGVEVGIPPLEWANEKITKTGGESDGGQCKALNTVLNDHGYKGGDRHFATLAIIKQWHDMRARLDSLSDITRAEAHLALEFFDKADEDALVALNQAASDLKRIPLILAKEKVA